MYLDFHGGSWFAEVKARFEYKGKEEEATLFLKLQEEKVGSKWILTKGYFAPFARLFASDTTGGKEFLHPLSHELDFMNLRKAFQDNKQKIDQFTERGYQPDYLSILLYELKKSNVRFKTVSTVKFHFFQVDGWYFQLVRFNRVGLQSWMAHRGPHKGIARRKRATNELYLLRTMIYPLATPLKLPTVLGRLVADGICPRPTRLRVESGPDRGIPSPSRSARIVSAVHDERVGR